eukprot:scaffold51449_cov35-Cyclotella_meneghiniana.AAC.2
MALVFVLCFIPGGGLSSYAVDIWRVIRASGALEWSVLVVSRGEGPRLATFAGPRKCYGGSLKPLGSALICSAGFVSHTEYVASFCLLGGVFKMFAGPRRCSDGSFVSFGSASDCSVNAARYFFWLSRIVELLAGPDIDHEVAGAFLSGSPRAASCLVPLFAEGGRVGPALSVELFKKS